MVFVRQIAIAAVFVSGSTLCPANSVTSDEIYTYIKSNGNSIVHIQRELSALSLQHLIMGKACPGIRSGVELHVSLEEEASSVMEAKVTVSSEQKLALDHALKLSSFYVKLRLGGHTAAYSANFVKTGFGDQSGYDDQSRSLFRVFGVRPGGWHRYKKRIISFPHMHVRTRVYVTTDGDLTWTSLVSNTGDSRSVLIYRLDPVEFRESLRPKLLRCAKSAEFEASKGDPSEWEEEYWDFLSSDLAKLGIKWRSPEELDPEWQFD